MYKRQRQARLAEPEFEELGDRWELITLYLTLASLYAQVGEWAQSEAYIERIRRLATVSKNWSGLAMAIRGSGIKQLGSHLWGGKNYIILVTALLFSQRVALLDGSDPASEWVGADGAPQPGRAPIGMLPELRTTRTAFNSNDPYWVPSPDERLDPAPTLCGLHGRALSPRTRMNATILAGRAPSGPSADGWTSEDAEAALLDNASLLAELLIDEVVRRATGVAVVTVDGREVELAEAVQLLTNWDRRFDLNSVGAIIWPKRTMSSGSLASISMSKTSTSAKRLKSTALPSITGLAASGPMSPRPSTAAVSYTHLTLPTSDLV